MDFKVLIDTKFATINSDSALNPIDRKTVLSISNDFEDGKWRYSKFSKVIWDNISESALSHKEKNSLVNQSLLIAAAQNLRLTDSEKDPTKGSELAEILLYALMKNHYGALPVVPKIFYKQNSQDFAKGADSVHIVLDEIGDFSLWFGEAKFYDSIDDTRLDKILDSIKNSLDTNKLKKENSIITSLNELDYYVKNDELAKKIKEALSNEVSLDTLKPKLHIPILLLHECNITSSAAEFTDELKEQLVKKHTERAQTFFKKQLKKLKEDIFKYEAIYFHLILFPVPDKEIIVNKFVENVKFYKSQEEK